MANRILFSVGLALGALALMVLFLFDPAQHAFYPRCYFYLLTGWQCPGCGSLRALHQLTHGNVAAAFRFNPLLVLAMPVGLVGGVIWWMRHRAGQLAGVDIHPKWTFLLAGIIVAFAVFRNVFSI